MADQITNYKCPACTGPLHFVGASGKLECDYCGSSYSVEEIEAIVRGETELDAALSARIMAIQKEKAALDRAGGDRRTVPAGACAVPDARRKAVSR